MKYVAERCILRDGRDFVLLFHWFRREDDSICVVVQSVDHPLCPPTPQFVRGKMLCCGYLISPLRENPNVSRVTQLCVVNLMSMNSLLVEFVARTEPISLHRLKKYVNENVAKQTVT
jgi:hypothetical protein